MEDTYSKVVRVGGENKENRRGRRKQREVEKNVSSSSNDSHGVRLLSNAFPSFTALSRFFLCQMQKLHRFDPSYVFINGICRLKSHEGLDIGKI